MRKEKMVIENGAADYEYPRPVLRRRGWISLNGPWSCAIDPEKSWSDPAQVPWNHGGATFISAPLP
jgi:hypothetical protein